MSRLKMMGDLAYFTEPVHVMLLSSRILTELHADEYFEPLPIYVEETRCPWRKHLGFNPLHH